MTIRIGISGWTYKGWRGRFYPEGLVQREELRYAAERFDSIEINGSFYSLQRPSSYARWRATPPVGFSFAVKAPRFITHMKKLKDVERPLANFFASGPLALGPMLGPILWQLPPNLRYDPERLERFLAQLPRTGDEASALARNHDERLAGDRVHLSAEGVPTLRHAVEVRHESFRDPAFIEQLRRHGVALVFADSVDWPYFEDVTADFVYLRLHGATERYASAYSGDELDRWAARLRRWHAGGEPQDAVRCAPRMEPDSSGRDAYVYFDNDAKVHAPFDAMALMARLKIQHEPASGPAAAA